MFGRVDSFGREQKIDFAPKSKAVDHFAEITRIIQNLDTAKARQGSGGATAKSVLLDAIRLDLQNIARTARAIDQAEPGFAESFRLPDGQGQTALLTTADAYLAELQQSTVAKKFIAYELPAEFVTDLTSDLQDVRAAQDDQETSSLTGVESTAVIGRLIRDGMKEITYLDAIMHNKYARTPETLRAWESASHIDRAPQRENKSKSQTAATNGNGAASAATPAKV